MSDWFRTLDGLHDRAWTVLGAAVALATSPTRFVTPAPGTPIARSEAYDRTPDLEQFAVLQIQLSQIDIVHLGADHHRLAFRGAKR